MVGEIIFKNIALLPKRLIRGVERRVQDLIKSFSVPDPDAYEIARYRELSLLGRDSPNAWIRKSADIPGWLFAGEHEFLWELATRRVPGDILEIGSWMGKSTSILAGACIDTAPESCVLCIDPFDMRGNDWQMQFHRKLVRDSETTFEIFRENARTHGYFSHVVPLVTVSERLLPRLQFNLRMVFLDGAHEYENVEFETRLLLPQLAVGGVLALHDTTGDFPGVKRFMDEQLAGRTDLRCLGTRGTITAFEKL